MNISFAMGITDYLLANAIVWYYKLPVATL